ncbi:MAG: ferredoxin family protein [Candidatus Thermoplasmatota archaeon]|jgi:NAD-dependent dihydropyrimidine dehydrogenase PreA subunit|nr:ferredoxin family protein [Candidatus Sysuiplasma jiujiangense]MBX8640159.1 ferredoxin family protein [Candidatus Sysuiplasma jiujiangense]MBX8642652.1 ferredoxin family protein [Candidatus Sysuiplasma jiujiangense]MCL4316895.1 ferredoxin family protein [Candidatus Thermoplasmatota archaeon]MCL5253733.1 ferredoxin family protein [Candidatus Thermoplasmatota archaeon]
MVELDTLDYKPKPIDQNFLNDEQNYPVTGEHFEHSIRAEGIQRLDAEGKPYPTKLGIHGTAVAVDWETCIADGACMDVCPVTLYEWALNLGQMGTGNDRKIADDKELWNKYRTDKCDPVREKDCVYCMACVPVCPTNAIKITEGVI